MGSRSLLPAGGRLYAGESAAQRSEDGVGVLAHHAQREHAGKKERPEQDDVLSPNRSSYAAVNLVTSTHDVLPPRQRGARGGAVQVLCRDRSVLAQFVPLSTLPATGPPQYRVLDSAGPVRRVRQVLRAILRQRARGRLGPRMRFVKGHRAGRSVGWPIRAAQQ